MNQCVCSHKYTHTVLMFKQKKILCLITKRFIRERMISDAGGYLNTTFLMSAKTDDRGIVLH